MLSFIELEGFQAFGLRQRVDLAPLTLIFGPNSSGKSSIGRLLRLFSQSLSGGNGLNFDGETVQLGSLRNVSFKNDVAEGFGAEFFIVPRSPGLQSLREPSKWIYVNGVRFASHIMEVKSKTLEIISIGFAVYESKNPGPSTNRGDLSLTFVCDEDSVSLGLFSAKGLAWLLTDFLESNSSSALDGIEIPFETALGLFPMQGDDHSNLQENAVFARPSDSEGSPAVLLKDLLGGLDFSKKLGPRLVQRGANAYFVPSFPGPSGPHREGFLRFLSQALEKARSETASHFSAFQYIGPLRAISSGYVPRSTNTTKLKSDGSNIQEHLASLPDKDFERISEDLQGLTDGHFCLRKHHVPPDVFEIGDHVQTVVYDLTSLTEVSFQNSGAGLAQVIPILAGIGAMSEMVFPGAAEGEENRNGSRREFAGTLFVEQPELHLHPKMQSNLADFLLSSTGNPKEANLRNGYKPAVICETHSEAFLLRIQRRIRDGDYPPSKVAIYFVDRLPGSESSYINRMELDEQGNFKHQWPVSFSDLRNQDR
jgi:hypothetical protein